MDRQEALRFEYRGQQVELLKAGDAGYDFRCPICGRIVLLRTTPGGHQLITDGQNRPTVNPSMVHKCGWHVWLRGGVATDA